MKNQQSGKLKRNIFWHHVILAICSHMHKCEWADLSQTGSWEWINY